MKQKTNLVNIEIGNRIKKIRVEKGYNQEQLASGVGLTRPSICNIESGKQAIQVDTLLKVCAILGAEPIDILPKTPKATIKEFSKVIKKPIESKTLDVHFKW